MKIPACFLLWTCSFSLVLGHEYTVTNPKQPVYATVKEDPTLPRMLIIGDSISTGYTPAVQKKMIGIANVLRIQENGGRNPKDVILYNEVAAKIMKENNIPVDDMYSYVFPHMKDWQLPKSNVHFTEKGSDKLAEDVVKNFKEQLGVK